MEINEITENTTIEDLLENYPDSSEYFLRYGIRCFTCSGVLWGTIGETLRDKKVEDIDAAVNELKEFIKAQQSVKS